MAPSSEFDYRKYLRLIKKKRQFFALVSFAIMTGFVIASYLLPKKYEAKSTVFIEKNVITELVKGLAVTPSMEDSIKVLSYALTSRSLLLKVVDELDLNVKNKSDIGLEKTILDIQKNIDVRVRDKNLFSITYKNENPQIARDLVNTLVRRYIEDNVSLKREESYGATKFLSEQLDTVRAKLEKSGTEVNNYKRDKGGLLSIDGAKLFQEINEAQQKLYDLELRRRHLEGLRPVTKKAGDPMQGQLFALQKRLNELRVEYTENYPEVIKVRTDIETLKEQIKGRQKELVTVTDDQELQKSEAEIAAIRGSEEGLKRYIARNQALLRSIPGARAGLEALELAKNNEKNLYDQLVTRHGQSEVSKQMEVQDKITTFRVVDPAILPIKPVSPNRVLIIIIGILAGLAGGVGIIILRDQLDRSVKSLDVLNTIGVPVLAVVPKIQDPSEIRLIGRKDRYLYLASAVYFLMIIAILGLEVAKSMSIDPFFIKQKMAQLNTQDLK